jgi:GxxExxY protein
MADEVNDLKYGELTEQIIGAFYSVYNTLGYGFLEKVYVRALAIELGKIGLPVQLEKPMVVYYNDTIIGEYYADIIVCDCVIIEVKAAKHLNIDHEAQLLNYLKASRLEIGLLLNFGPKPEVKRRIFNIV